MLEAVTLWFTRKLGMDSQAVPSPSFVRIRDPRELPRPRRFRTEEIPRDSSHTTCHCHSRYSCCRNCNELQSSLGECNICLQPMGSLKLKSNIHVTSCCQCGNIACGLCAMELSKCPFCRSNPGLVPNFALQKLINNLEIPCRKVSWSGMELECDGQELECVPLPPIPMNKSPNPVLCLHKNCQWIGELDQLAQHLSDSHSTIVFEGQSVSLIIHDFKRKVELTSNKPRNYVLILSYLSNTIVFKITLIGTKFRFVLVSVKSAEILDFGIWIEIGCNKKQIAGVMPLLKKRVNSFICVKSLLSVKTKKSDPVTINLMLRPFS